MDVKPLARSRLSPPPTQPLLPAMPTDVLETPTLWLFPPALPPGDFLVPLPRGRNKAVCFHYHHHYYFPKTAPAMIFPSPFPVIKATRLSEV